MPKAVKKVFVGLSGGVDSSVSAALLQARGFDVTGVFIKVWQPDWIECTAKEDRLDAMRVCAALGIPFKEVNLEKEYKLRVIDYMIKEYAAGNTPNPDVMCNTFVKFGAFYDWAIQEGADFVATGHYAQVVSDKQGYHLLRGIDPKKDQSYFLWGIKKEQLPKIMFPVGGMRKLQVRALARKFKLPTASKKDSQGLCFLGKIDVKDFIKKYVETTPGKVVNENGKIIGTHPGALLFTLGERHGFSIITTDTHHKAFYVTGKDLARNTITVGHFPPVSRKENIIQFHSGNFLEETFRTAKAQVRYHGPLVSCSIQHGEDGAIAKLGEAASAVSPGQSVVFYSGKICLGGGIIAP